MTGWTFPGLLAELGAKVSLVVGDILEFNDSRPWTGIVSYVYSTRDSLLFIRGTRGP